MQNVVQKSPKSSKNRGPRNMLKKRRLFGELDLQNSAKMKEGSSKIKVAQFRAKARKVFKK